MNGKRNLLALSLAGLLCLSACSGSSDTSAVSNTAWEGDWQSSSSGSSYTYDDTYEEISSVTTEGGASSESKSDSSYKANEGIMMRKHVDATLSSRDFEAASSKLDELVDEYATVTLRDSTSMTDYSRKYYSRTMEFRVRSEKVNDFVEALKNVDVWYCESVDVSADDMTPQYLDNERRIEALEMRYDFYKEQMETATDPEMVAEYSELMFDTLEQLEGLRSNQTGIETDVDYSIVNLRLDEDTTISDIDASSGLWQEIVDEVTVLPKNIAAAFGFLLLMLVHLLPFLLVVLAVVVIVRIVAKKTAPQREAKRAEREAKQAEVVARNMAKREGMSQDVANTDAVDVPRVVDAPPAPEEAE